MKRGRDNGQFLNRRFVLSLRDGTLKYYTKLDVSDSTSMQLDHRQTNIVFVKIRVYFYILSVILVQIVVVILCF